MEITQVKIFPVHEDKLKAFVSIVFDHCFMVNDIKVIQGKDGLFLSMPSRRKKNGEFKDVAHPLNNETRQLIEEVVLREYRQVAGDRTPRRQISAEEEEAEAEAGRRGFQRPQFGGRPDAARPAEARPAEARPGAARPDAARPDAARPDAEEAEGEKTLEEVEELHLRDSFWSVS